MKDTSTLGLVVGFQGRTPNPVDEKTPTNEIPSVEERWEGTYWGFDAYFATEEAAEAFAGLFPKYAKVRISKHSYPINGTYLDGTGVIATVIAEGKITADKVNKGANETGSKRRNAIEKVLRSL